MAFKIIYIISVLLRAIRKKTQACHWQPSDNTCISASSSPHNKKREEKGTWELVTINYRETQILVKRKLPGEIYSVCIGSFCASPRVPRTTERCPCPSYNSVPRLRKGQRSRWHQDTEIIRSPWKVTGWLVSSLNIWLKILYSLQFYGTQLTPYMIGIG